MEIITTDEILHQALKLYNLKQPVAEFIRHSENMTYKITDINKKYLLRIHKSVTGLCSNIYTNYSRNELIQNEIELILDLKNNTNLSVQTPIRGLNGNFVQTISDNSDNIPVTMLEWVEGELVRITGTTPELLFNGGKMIAEMHSFFSSQAQMNNNYKRYSYDQTILPIIADEIEDMAHHNIVNLEQSKIIFAALDEMRVRFDELDNMQEKHIIHADLTQNDVVVDKNGLLTPIDFGICGYGHFYMDINLFNGSFTLSHDVIEGYKSVRNCEIIPYFMEPYIVLGFLLFIRLNAQREKEWNPSFEPIEEWCRDIFKPLADKINFVKME
ncbi:MAG: phosphotransferase [Oscillospiraceae bacterium]|nr:phosphotransferase [Oscillospiraceae bacterium]